MNKPFVDLHIHSLYSDGTMTPQEIADAAEANGVGIIAVADHNVLEGNILTRELCKGKGIQCIPAVELFAVDEGRMLHVLAYGFDEKDISFNEYLNYSRLVMEETGVALIDIMAREYSNVSVDEYLKFSYERHLGGWKTLHYLLGKGFTTALKQGYSFGPKYGVTNDNSGFASIAAVVCRTKMAGGVSVLAHPGQSLATNDIDEFKRALKKLVAYGLDGIECYYPTHSGAVVQACLDVCNEYGLMVTAGSDCHGGFGNSRVGEMNITVDKLKLGNLYS